MGKNYYMISGGGLFRCAYNSVTPDFADAVNGGEHILSHIYLTCQSGTLKAVSTVISGSAKNRFLLLSAQFNLEEEQQIAAAGTGTDSRMVSFAEINPTFSYKGKLTVTAAIFFEFSGGGVLDFDFLRLLAGENLQLLTAPIDGEKLESCINGQKPQELFDTQKIINGGVLYKPTREFDSAGAVFYAGGKPVYYILDKEFEDSPPYLLPAANFIVDDGCRLTPKGSRKAKAVPYGNTYLPPCKAAFLFKLQSQNFTSSSLGSYIAQVEQNRAYIYEYFSQKTGLYQNILTVDLQGSAAHSVSEGGFAAVYTDGTVRVWNFATGTAATLPKKFEGASKLALSDNLDFFLAHGEEKGYYYFPSTDNFEQFYKVTQNFTYNAGSNIITRYYSGLVLHYAAEQGALRYITTSADMFINIKPEQKLSAWYFTMVKNADGGCMLSNYSGQVAAIGGGGDEVIAVSHGLKYFLLRFRNGALRLFRFSKKHMIFSEVKGKEALALGDYFFAGDDKLICVNKGASVYRVFNDKTEIILSDSASGDVEISRSDKKVFAPSKRGFKVKGI